MNNKLTAFQHIQNIIKQGLSRGISNENDDKFYIRSVNSLFTVIFKALNDQIIADKNIANIFITQYNILGLNKVFGDYSDLIYLIFETYFKYADIGPVQSQVGIELLTDFLNKIEVFNDDIQNTACYIVLIYLENNRLLTKAPALIERLSNKIIASKLPNATDNLFYSAF